MSEQDMSVLSEAPAERSLLVRISHHSETHDLVLPATASISDLAELILAELDVPVEHQKLLVPSKGMFKPPFKDDVAVASLSKAVVADITALLAGEGEVSTSTVNVKPIKLLAPSKVELESLVQTAEHAKRRLAAREAALSKGRSIRPNRNISGMDSLRIQQESQYTFHDIRPLDHHRRNESLALLYKLRDDPGIKTAMRKHKFTVGLLTEMDPALHTTHESRTLGLNRNKGEIIELRLLTDDRAGMRDYKSVRRTLCHELTHNVWGDHDRNFWDLCKQIEKEVEQNDTAHGGHRMSENEYFDPEERNEHIDGGGFEGGEWRLGGDTATSEAGGSGALTRRELMAKAAEERLKRSREDREKGSGS